MSTYASHVGDSMEAAAAEAIRGAGERRNSIDFLWNGNVRVVVRPSDTVEEVCARVREAREKARAMKRPGWSD